MANIIKITCFNSNKEEFSYGTCRMTDEDFKNYLNKLKHRADVTGFTHEVVGGVNYIQVYYK